MGRGDRRKCKCCLKVFRPDPRNRRHQCYCSARACRAASKTASQARWRAKPENQSYFRGAVNVARVQAWRSRHPGYWRKGRRGGPALQDVSMAQPIGPPIETANAAWSPLQDVLTAQPAVLIGLIAHIVGARYKMTSSAPPAVCYDWARTFLPHGWRRYWSKCVQGRSLTVKSTVSVSASSY
jgi:hypothetical protein